MQNDTSKFVVNIIPLQNVNASVSGTNAVNVLSNNVVAIQQMVNTSNNSIRTNTIQSYTSNTSINFISPINLCNVGITSNGLAYTTSGAGGTLTHTDIQEIATVRFRSTHTEDLNIGHEHLDTRDFMMALKLGSRLAISGVVVRVLLHFKVTPKAREAILWIVMILNCCESNISGHRRLDT